MRWMAQFERDWVWIVLHSTKSTRAIVVIQLTAHKGEKPGPRDDYPGYDPIAQAITGVMDRFGPDGCPTYHGVASCVDYLCGYLGAWAGVTALLARRADATTVHGRLGRDLIGASRAH